MRNILLVDDDSGFRRSLAIGLEAAGYNIYEAENGMEALELLDKNRGSVDRIDGVVVDARMPGLDGFLLCDQILSLYPDLSVIILSAYPYPGKMDRYTVLTKPVEISKLIEKLEDNGDIHSRSY